MVALLRMVSPCWLISTLHPDLVRMSNHRLPGNSLVTSTRFSPSGLKTCTQATTPCTYESVLMPPISSLKRCIEVSSLHTTDIPKEVIVHAS